MNITAPLSAGTWTTAGAAEPGALLRRECRALARRRALLAAASSLVPLPGVDLVTDIALLTKLIGRINEHFGLTDEQIGRLSGERQALLYRLLANAGGTLARRLTTPVLVGRIVRLAGVRLTAMEATRLVPVAGQVVAAGIGYWTFNTIALRHIAHCERVVSELQRQSAEN